MKAICEQLQDLRMQHRELLQLKEAESKYQQQYFTNAQRILQII